jgi:hypothetical protein
MRSVRSFSKHSLVRGSLLVALGAVLSSTSGCVNTDYSGSGGASGSSGEYTPPTCGQACQDFAVAYGLNDTLWFLWNQLVAGRPSGVEDTTGVCPLGGTVHITGTTGVSDTGISTANLVFDLADCANSDTLYDFSYTGEVTMVGSFQTATDFAAMTYGSVSLEAAGTVSYLDEPAVSESCGTNFAQEGSGDAWRLAGRMCGRPFDSDTALDPYAQGSGGSGGSGGSSAGTSGRSGAGGTGNDCRCFCPDNSDCTNATEPNPCGLDADGIPEACGCPVGCR